MTKKYRLHFSLWVAMLVLSSICAQAQTVAQPPTDAQARTPLVSATATAEQVRFVSPGEIIRMRLEVFASGGEILFDSDFKFGNLLDWPVQDQQGQRLSDGAYLCTVTIKDLAGHTSRKYGTALVQAGQVSLSPPEPEWLSGAQQQALEAGRKSQAPGTGASNDYFTILREGTVIPTTALAHDGSNGQLVTSIGALSFRAGDFFAGKNVERMRLTAEGNLGIGVEAPKSKLDVAGAIRTSEGVVFPDGSLQTTAYVAPGRSLGDERERLKRDAQGRAITEPDNKTAESGKNLRFTPNISGSGTTGRITKWVDGPLGVVADSVVSESGGNVGIGPGTTSPGEKFSVGYGANTDIAIGSATSNKTYLGSFLNNTVFAINRRVSDGNFANPSLPTASFGFYTSSGDSSIRFGTSNTNGVIDLERMRIDKNGNIGIGTSTPGEKLSVGYGANTDIAIGSLTNNKTYLGSFNNNTVFAINRRVSDGNFANPALPTASFGFYTSSGDSSIRFNTSSTNGVLDTERMRIDKNGNVGIGTTSPPQQLSITGGLGFANQNAADKKLWSPADGTLRWVTHNAAGAHAFEVSHQDATTYWHLDTTNNSYYNGPGNVGIGTTNPASKLEVNVPSSTSPIGAMSVDVQSFVTNANAIASYYFRVRDLGAGTPFYIRGDGNVGIGTNTPGYKLDISGVMRISGTGAPANNVTSGLHFGSQDSGYKWIQSYEAQPLVINPLGNNVGIGTTSPTAKLEVVGTIKTQILQITGGSDLSEQFEVNEVSGPGHHPAASPIQSGMVVSIDPASPGELVLTSRAYDRKVAGIISGAGGVKPGMLMGQSGSIADGKHPVALSGRVYCWADTSNGPINPGDLLTTSAIPGHAMKVADHKKAQGAIIGKAMTSLKKGKGLVLVLVTLQ